MVIQQVVFTSGLYYFQGGLGYTLLGLWYLPIIYVVPMSQK